jgi:hypothetical protein
VTIVSGSKLQALSLIALPFADEPLNWTVPKFVSGSTRQLPAHIDGASAIHSAELSAGLASVLVVLKLCPPPESVSVKLPLPGVREWLLSWRNRHSAPRPPLLVG